MTSSDVPLRKRLGRAGGSPVRRASIGTLLSGFAGQAVMVVSGVIAARLLGPEDRGYLALLVLVPLIVAKVGGLGIPLAVTYYVARDRPATAGIWAALRPLVLFQAALLAGVHMVALWALLSDEPQYVTDAALYTVLLVPAVLAQDYGLALLQARGRFTAFNILRLTPIVIYAAGVTVLLVMDLDGLSEIAAVWAGANVVLGALTMVVALSGIGRVVDGHEIPRVREMVAFGAKGLLGANSAIEYYRVDQAVVGLFLTPIALGLYSVGLAFTNLPRSIANSLGRGGLPPPGGADRPGGGPPQAQAVLRGYRGLVRGVVAVLEVTAGWLVPFFFGDEFKDSVPIVRIVLVSGLLIAARRILSDGARGLGLSRARHRGRGGVARDTGSGARGVPPALGRRGGGVLARRGRRGELAGDVRRTGAGPAERPAGGGAGAPGAVRGERRGLAGLLRVTALASSVLACGRSGGGPHGLLAVGAGAAVVLGVAPVAAVLCAAPARRDVDQARPGGREPPSRDSDGLRRAGFLYCSACCWWGSS